MTRAVEVKGIVDEHGRLELDQPISGAGPVRVILLFDSEADIDGVEWHRAASRNPAFDFLNHPGENLYSAEDGEAFRADAPAAAL